MAARCPYCEAVHPIQAEPGGQFMCPCGATALLCAPNTEPATSVFLGELGLSDTRADVLDEGLSIVWAREWSRRWGLAVRDVSSRHPIGREGE